jgi:hypothetical protein
MLGSAEAIVTVTSSADEWTAQGRLVTADREEQEGFAFLCALDPVFSLRFDDDRTTSVNVHLLDDDPGQFKLTEYTGPTERQVNYKIDLRPPAEPPPSDSPNTRFPNIT